MTPLARRLGFVLTLTAAGAAGVLAWVDRAIAAGCRDWRPEGRGAARLLDAGLSAPNTLYRADWGPGRIEWRNVYVPYDPETMHVAIFDKGAPPRPLP